MASRRLGLPVAISVDEAEAEIEPGRTHVMSNPRPAGFRSKQASRLPAPCSRVWLVLSVPGATSDERRETETQDRRRRRRRAGAHKGFMASRASLGKFFDFGKPSAVLPSRGIYCACLAGQDIRSDLDSAHRRCHPSCITIQCTSPRATQRRWQITTM